MSHEKYKYCIDACYACAVICEHCASQDLKENDVKMMIHCIELNRQCASICRFAAELMSMGSVFATQLCKICAEACDDCARECEKHTHMQHCTDCAAACRRCADECRKMV